MTKQPTTSLSKLREKIVDLFTIPGNPKSYLFRDDNLTITPEKVDQLLDLFSSEVELIIEKIRSQDFMEDLEDWDKDEIEIKGECSCEYAEDGEMIGECLRCISLELRGNVKGRGVILGQLDRLLSSLSPKEGK